MSNLQESLLSSMEILAGHYMDKNPGTITIECELTECINEATGEYRAIYLDNLIKVCANNPDKRYNKGDKVLVIVPNGDFSKQKIILSASTPSTMMYDIGDVDSLLKVSDNLFEPIEDKYNITLSTANNTIYVGNTSYKGQYEFKSLIGNRFKQQFSKYLKEHNSFLFSVKIKTDILEERQKNGNYGFILSLPFKYRDSENNEIKTIKKYVLDVNNISGNPYRLRDYSTQTILISLNNGEEYDDDPNVKPTLSIFIKDFTEKLEDKTRDIFIKDVGFYVFDELTDEQKTGYYLHLEASEGKYFFNDEKNTKKTITPELLIDGRKVNLNAVSANESYRCYWFIEDSSIRESSIDYTSFGGVGWRCLNNKTNVTTDAEGIDTFDYITNSYKLEVKQEDVITSARYKCVIAVIKKDSSDIEKYTQLVSAVLRLENLNTNNIQISLVSATGSNSYAKNIGVVNLICSVVNTKNSNYIYKENEVIAYEWNRYNKSNEYIDNKFYKVKEKDNNKQSIYFNSDIIEDINIFTCSVYSRYEENGTYINKLLGTKNISIDTNGISGMRLAIQNGDILFKYDIDGDAPTSEKYDGVISSKIIIKPLEYKIYKEDGQEFNEDEYKACKTTWYIPKNSLIKINKNINSENDKYYIRNERILNYEIHSSYNYSKDDNTILLKVKYGDIELNAEAALKFTKEGENGTNNSAYSAIIRYGSEDIDRHMQLVYFPSKNNKSLIGWFFYDVEKKILTQILNDSNNDTRPVFYPIVYNDGYRVTDNENIKYEWSVFNEISNKKDGEIDSEAFISLESKNNSIKMGIKDNSNPYYITTNGNREIKNSVNIIQLKTTIKKDEKIVDDATVGIEEKIKQGGITEIYSYYPIEFIVIENENDIMYVTEDNVRKVTLMPTCGEGFSTVTYASDGTNPKYNSSIPFSCYNNANKDLKYESNSISWECSDENLTQKKQEDGSCIVKPKTTYNSDIIKNYVRATINKGKDSNINAEIEKINNEIARINEDKKEIQKINFEVTYDEKGNIIDRGFFNLLLDKDWTKEKQSNGELVSIIPKIKEYLIFRKNKILLNVEELERRYKQLIEYDALKDKFKNFDFNKLKRAFINEDSEYYKGISAIKKVNESYFFDGDILSSYYSLNDESLKKIVNQSSKLLKQYQTQYNLLYYDIFHKFNNHNSNDNKEKTYYQNVYNSYLSFRKLKDNYKNLPTIKIPSFNINTNEIILFKNFLNEITTQFKNLGLKLTDSSVITYKDFLSFVEEYDNTIFSYCYEEKNNILKLLDNYDIIINNSIKSLDNEISKKNNELISITMNNTDKIVCIRPIIMNFNRYELGAISGWDGSRLYTGQDNSGDYLYAPQVGAGRKEAGGTFTGIVIGRKKSFSKDENKKGEEQVGLFGYSSGAESIFLDATSGKATFGKAGEGQIKMVPGGTSTIAGWEINKYSLSKSIGDNYQVGLYAYPDADDEEYIENIEKHPTEETADGTKHNVAVRATDGKNIACITYDGWFKSNYGNIGGWTIDKETISSENYGNTNSKTILNKDGTITCQNLIAKNEGSIGGWKIGTDTLKGITYEADGVTPKHTLTLNANGSMSGPNWSIESSGDATFNNITCNDTWSFGSSRDGNTWTSGQGFSFGNGTVGLGTTGLNQAKKNGIYYGPNPEYKGGGAPPDICIINGDIHANNGYFEGEIHAKEGGTIGQLEITKDGLSYIAQDGDNTRWIKIDPDNGVSTNKLHLNWLADIEFFRTNIPGDGPPISGTFLDIIAGFDTISSYCTSSYPTSSFTTADGKTVEVASNGVILSIKEKEK